jgi:carnitine 3-dehydrogenase
MRRQAAVIGGGVIGGGWLARFLLNGWDVAVYDPDPEAERKIAEVLANARRSLPGLYDAALPPEGQLRYCRTIEDTVHGAEWIQESVPERLELKREALKKVQAAAGTGAVIGSSTSGFKPSDLGAGLQRPGQVLVAHPFNPVYLLPLVEVVPQAGMEPAFVERAMETLRSIGMMPLHLRREIDAHVADRLLESVWREALWLVKDDVATTSDIDDAIRFGFGIRWAQMGLFETYRIAGGEAGMAHFLAQFGPCLHWPWTRLTEVPDLDASLIDRISSQSDAQSGARSIRELERVRDDNLVAIMRALKGRDWASGRTHREHDARLRGRVAAADWSQPVETVARTVPVDWTDHDGLMSEARYLEAFGNAVDRFLELAACDSASLARGAGYVTAESYLRHYAAARLAGRVRVTTQLLDGSGEYLHVFSRMFDAGGCLLATAEQLLVHVSLATRRATPPGEALQARLGEIRTLHSALPQPEDLRCGRHKPEN